MDIAALARHVVRSPTVATVEILPFCCSSDGRTFLAETIAANRLNRVVIAACSPLEHELTFQDVMAKAGLNPFLLQRVNLREQCAWVTQDAREATAKAICAVRGAIARAVLHEPLSTPKIECETDVMVLGAGVAGISAALALASKERHVYLVDKAPCIGGKVARFQHLFPDLECASCLLAGQWDALLHHERIHLLTLTRVRRVEGYLGNFLVELVQERRGVDPSACMGCGLCQETCPVGKSGDSPPGSQRQSGIAIPHPGALPHVAVIDAHRCLRFQGQDCDACEAACPHGAIRHDEGDRSHNIKVGAIVVATGYALLDTRRAPQYGHGVNPWVITGMELEHLLSVDGPTGGKVLRADGRPPASVALVHCVGSRCGRFNAHCSGLCCRLSLKYAARILQELPETMVSLLHSDLCLPGREPQRLLATLSASDRARFLRMAAPDAVEVTAHRNGALIRYREAQGELHLLDADLVVLLTAMEGSEDGAELAGCLDVRRDENGFFMAAHPQLDPVSSTREGIFLAGCALGPCDVPTAIMQGQAASGKILARLIPGETISLQATTASILAEHCSRCGLCRAVCPSSAIHFPGPDNPPSIHVALCAGCGTCAVACPSGAIRHHHFTDAQILAELSELTRDP